MIMFYCLCANILVKLAVFGSTDGDMFRSGVFYVAVLSSLIEHVIFVATIFLIGWKCALSTVPARACNKFYRMVYLSLAYPELAKACALVLFTWDSGIMLLLFVGILILSIQYNAFSIVVKHTFPHANMHYTFIVACAARLGCRLYFLNTDKTTQLGFLL